MKFNASGIQKTLASAPSALGRLVGLLALSCLLAALASGCGSPKTDTAPPDADTKETTTEKNAPAAAPARVAGIRLTLLDQAGLHLQWQVQLPLGQANSIESIFHHHNQLYLINDQNVLTAVDPARGTVIWSEKLGPAILPCSEPTYYKDRLLFSLGDTAVEIREKDGKKTLPQGSVKFKFPLATSVARTEDYLFAGSTNRNFYCIRIADGTPVWQSIRPEEPTGTIAAHVGKVYFTRRDAVLYVSRTERRQLLWNFEQASDIMPGVVVDGTQCFLPSLDTTLFCLHANTGSIIWQYLGGGSLTELPVITETAVYQPVASGALLCLNRNTEIYTGDLRWELPDGKSLLAENGSVTYAITTEKELVLMDNLKGKRILSFYVPNIDLYAPNTEDSTIFLAAKNGRIISLRPNRIEAPFTPR